jgi:hypothetical protein
MKPKLRTDECHSSWRGRQLRNHNFTTIFNFHRSVTQDQYCCEPITLIRSSIYTIMDTWNTVVRPIKQAFNGTLHLQSWTLNTSCLLMSLAWSKYVNFISSNTNLNNEIHDDLTNKQLCSDSDFSQINSLKQVQALLGSWSMCQKVWSRRKLH